MPCCRRRSGAVKHPQQSRQRLALGAILRSWLTCGSRRLWKPGRGQSAIGGPSARARSQGRAGRGAGLARPGLHGPRLVGSLGLHVMQRNIPQI
jgi:hypothetical protein